MDNKEPPFWSRVALLCFDDIPDEPINIFFFTPAGDAAVNDLEMMGAALLSRACAELGIGNKERRCRWWASPFVMGKQEILYFLQFAATIS